VPCSAKSAPFAPGATPGWRDEALSRLTRLATSPYPKRDLLELRTEAVAALGTPDVQLIGKTDYVDTVCSFAILPDSQTLATVSGRSGLGLLELPRAEVHRGDRRNGGEVSNARLGSEQGDLSPGRAGPGRDDAGSGRSVQDLSGKRTSRPAITQGTLVPAHLSG